LVLRLKPRNCRGDFEVKSSNRRYWFWGPNRETQATSFEVKPEETVATGFEAKPKKAATGYEAKPEKTVPVVLRPNRWQTSDLGFVA
jgi:hypothetical protein